MYLAGEDLQRKFGPAASVLDYAPTVSGPHVEGLSCPVGCGEMEGRLISDSLRTTVIDICTSCHGVWFDGGELQAVFRAGRSARRRAAHQAASSRPDPEALAQEQLRNIETIQRTGEDHVSGGDGTWFIQFITGLPVEGFNPVHRFPLVTWSLIAACVIVFVVELALGETFVGRFVLIPKKLFAGEEVVSRIVGSMFLHGGIMHLVGNMYFLKIFGDNVEDRMGRGRFLMFYLVCGTAACLAQALSNPSSEIWVLGASGAIGGILASYMYFFPDARITVAPVLWTLFRRFSVRAIFYFPFWFIWQVVAMSFGGRGVAWWAHIGGFLCGLALSVPLSRKEDARIASLAKRHT